MRCDFLERCRGTEAQAIPHRIEGMTYGAITSDPMLPFAELIGREDRLPHACVSGRSNSVAVAGNIHACYKADGLFLWRIGKASVVRIRRKSTDR